MPGKVNPVIAESLHDGRAQVVGNDATIALAAARSGNFELNVMMPVMAYNLLQSIGSWRNALRACSPTRCIDGIEPNEERCAALVEQSLAMATALNAAIGYDMAAEAIATRVGQERQDRARALPREKSAAARRAGSTARRATHDRSIIGNSVIRLPRFADGKEPMPRTPPRRLLGSSSFYLVLLFGLSGLGATGCPGSLDPALLPTGGAGSGGGGPCDAVPILTAKCGYPGLCHDNRALAPGGLDLMTAPFDRLVGDVPDGTNTSQCAGVTTPYLVAGSNPAMGLLLDKLTTAAPCGAMMPTLDTLTPTEVTCLQSWATGLTSPAP